MTGRADTSIPLWLLDVDGVLNAVVRQPDRRVWRDWQHGIARADGVDWPIWFSPSVSSTVARLHSTGLAEVRWLTTWGRHANGDLRRLLDLPELEVAAEPPTSQDQVQVGAAGTVLGAISHGEATVRGTSGAGSTSGTSGAGSTSGGNGGNGTGGTSGSGGTSGTSGAGASAAEVMDAPRRISWWKFDAVRRIAAAEPDRPVIWTDDDLSAYRDAVTWAEHHLTRRLILSPRSALGLTPRQIRAIRAFCGD